MLDKTKELFQYKLNMKSGHVLVVLLPFKKGEELVDHVRELKGGDNEVIEACYFSPGNPLSTTIWIFVDEILTIDESFGKSPIIVAEKEEAEALIRKRNAEKKNKKITGRIKEKNARDAKKRKF